MPVGSAWNTLVAGVALTMAGCVSYPDTLRIATIPEVLGSWRRLASEAEYAYEVTFFEDGRFCAVDHTEAGRLTIWGHWEYVAADRGTSPASMPTLILDSEDGQAAFSILSMLPSDEIRVDQSGRLVTLCGIQVLHSDPAWCRFEHNPRPHPDCQTSPRDPP